MNKLLARAGAWTCTLAALLLTNPALAQGVATSVIDPALAQNLQALARQAADKVWSRDAQPGPGLPSVAPRVEVELGQLDPRLQLAPCHHIEPYIPAGVRMAGRTRIGVRCLQGTTKWNVSIPLTVRILARALVSSTSLPSGTVVRVHHLAEAEVDLAANLEPVIHSADQLVGRTLARPLAAGEAFRSTDLKVRHWFAAGELVKVVAVGPGFAVSAEGLALGPGLEGQPARVRTDSGRIVVGMPTGERRVEIPL